MTMTCTICRSPHRREIETAIVHLVSYRKIGRLYGVGYRSVGRHLHGCLRRMIRAALQLNNET